jgi:hypothetical protein
MLHFSFGLLTIVNNSCVVQIVPCSRCLWVRLDTRFFQHFGLQCLLHRVLQEGLQDFMCELWWGSVEAPQTVHQNWVVHPLVQCRDPEWDDVEPCWPSGRREALEGCWRGCWRWCWRGDPIRRWEVVAMRGEHGNSGMWTQGEHVHVGASILRHWDSPFTRTWISCALLFLWC